MKPYILMESTIVPVFLFVLVLLFLCEFKSCVATRDAITCTSELLDNETLLSSGKRFELGFFNLEDGINGRRYVGIWYYNLSSRTVVWVANRNAPLNVPGSFLISADGNLKLSDNNGSSYFHTNLESSTAVNRTLRLLDSGNLALIDDQSREILWQSFSEPTDTFLPGMMMDKNLRLVSWLDPGNPATGSYSFQEDKEDNRLYVIMKNNIIHWKSDESESTEMSLFLKFLNKSTDAAITSKAYNSTNAGKSINYNFTNNSYVYNFSNSRLLMNSSGEIQFYSLEDHQWSLLWSEPLFPPCGKFGISDVTNGGSICKCLPGFDPVSPDGWKNGDFSNGCARKLPICIENSKEDRFLNLKFLTLQEPGLPDYQIDTADRCKQKCLSSCETQCEAYYFSGWRNGSTHARASCWIWTSTLNNLRHNDVDGHDLSIRVPASAIEKTSGDCEPCGEYIIPYPLSTTPGCGDPWYQSFSCDYSTGQLFFQNLKDSYQVIDINVEDRRFVIQVNNQTTSNCDARTSVLQLKQSLPFIVTNWCYSEPTDGPSTHGIEIGWKPALEPRCNSSIDCQDWPDSNCSAYQATKRCLCNANYLWDNVALKCNSAVYNPNHSEAVIIVTAVIAVVLLAGSFSCFLCRRRIFTSKGESKESIPRTAMLFLYDNEREAEDLVDEDDNTVDLPYFSLESLIAATGNFADVNKLGQGGFGPVYRGTFPGGKEIAIKRLLSHTGQGMEEFRNEVVLIAKLQHRNLVRLLGYCIRGSEKLLLYEYMPNKSLDTFIFDEGRCIWLDWNLRYNIILGIARGLLYLHQDSRLRIIHRDLKTSNILLDEEMNPKISDFGLARIFAGKDMEASTMRVVGTYGYMSPEYAQAGFYSVKSDVFSFGVILLEIVSGKRNTGFYHSGEALSLLGYAWRLWEERNAINLFDKRILQSCNEVDVMKCINIGLLCVQEDPGDRPTMSDVLIMLSSEVTTLPSPKQPGFVSDKYASSLSASSSRQAETNTVNKMSITLLEGR